MLRMAHLRGEVHWTVPPLLRGWYSRTSLREGRAFSTGVILNLKCLPRVCPGIPPLPRKGKSNLFFCIITYSYLTFYTWKLLDLFLYQCEINIVYMIMCSSKLKLFFLLSTLQSTVV